MDSQQIADPESVASGARMAEAVVATGACIVTLVLIPALLFRRLLAVPDAVESGFQLLRPEDPMLVVGVLMWLGIAGSLITSNRALRPVPGVASSVQSLFRGVVERSFFGSGPFLGWTETNADEVLQFAPVEEAPPVVSERSNLASGQQQTAVPASGSASRMRSSKGSWSEPIAKSAESPSVPSEPYVVARGDTPWSLALRLLGDGRDWSLIRDLNFGREVSPGVLFDPSSPLLPGWTILVPTDTDVGEESA